MNKFKIELKEKKAYSSILKADYDVETEGFKSVVTVLHFDNENPFVHETKCAKGNCYLGRFLFWNKLHTDVLEYHSAI